MAWGDHKGGVEMRTQYPRPVKIEGLIRLLLLWSVVTSTVAVLIAVGRWM